MSLPRAGALAIVPLAVLLGASTGVGQESTGSLQGVVRLEESGEGVDGAQVFLPRLGRSTITDRDGRFTLVALPAGIHGIEVSRVGLERRVQEVRVYADSTTTVVVRLDLAPVRLPGIEVEGRSSSFLPDFLARREALQGYFFTKSDIDALAPERLTQVVEGLYGVDVEFTAETGWRVRVWNQERATRAQSRYCEPHLVLNGRLSPAWRRLNDIRIEDVLALEVYWKASEVPRALQYISLDQDMRRRCGVVAVWTELRPGG